MAEVHCKDREGECFPYSLQPLGTFGAIRGREAPAVGGQGWRSFAPQGGLGSAVLSARQGFL